MEKFIHKLTRYFRSKEPVKSNLGYCHCCRSNVLFISNETWLRESYKCSKCNSIPRFRHLQHILDKFFQNWENKEIHESSPSTDLISRYCGTNYTSSQFFIEVTPGELHNGVRCENLEHLTFKDNSFDIFITQDVFEHIFNPNLAAQEIMRVLKPGGIHIFTAPKLKHFKASYPRATKSNGEIHHLHEEQYHGNPVGDGRSLVTWDYGDDFEHLMYQWCGFHTVTYVTRDDSLGIDGEYLEVFVTRKI